MKDLYFKSEASRIMFILVEIGSTTRASLLNITGKHYRDKEVAEKWYENLIDILNKEKSHPSYEAAITQLNIMYSIMAK